MRPTLIAILCGLVPLVAIHAAWLYSMYSDSNTKDRHFSKTVIPRTGTFQRDQLD